MVGIQKSWGNKSTTYCYFIIISGDSRLTRNSTNTDNGGGIKTASQKCPLSMKKTSDRKKTITAIMRLSARCHLIFIRQNLIIAMTAIACGNWMVEILGQFL